MTREHRLNSDIHITHHASTRFEGSGYERNSRASTSDLEALLRNRQYK